MIVQKLLHVPLPENHQDEVVEVEEDNQVLLVETVVLQVENSVMMEMEEAVMDVVVLANLNKCVVTTRLK